MTNTSIFSLIELERRGALPETDQQELLSWLRESPDHKTTYQDVQEILDLSTSLVPTVAPQTETCWAALQDEIHTENNGKNVLRLRKAFHPWMGIAAALILLVVVGIVVFPGLGHPSGSTAVYTTAKGETLKIKLPDHSEVTLNAGSSLVLADNFGNDERPVTLEGEAFFDIARNEAKPFIIQASGTKTTVLGTSFNVLAYPEQSEIQISVAAGKVQFESPQETVILESDETGTYNLVTGKIATSFQPDPEKAAWRSGKLIFRNAPLPESLHQLEQYYDLEFELGPVMRQKRITDQIDVGEVSESELIEKLEGIYQIKAEKTGHLVTLVK